MFLVIDKIVRRLKPRFPFSNYGYAGAICQGRLTIEQAQGAPRLKVVAPPIIYSPSDLNPLPYYSCDTASEIVTREAHWNRLPAKKIEMTIPYVSSQGEKEVLVHKLAVVREENENYLVGLTPFDVLLGIYPFQKMKNHRRPNVPSFFLEKAGTLEIEENPSWELQNLDFQIKPIKTRFLSELMKQLLVTDLGVGLMNGSLIIACLNRLIRFEGALVVEGENDFFLSLPINRLSFIVEGMRFFDKDAFSPLLFLCDNGWAKITEGFSNDFSEIATRKFALESWPIVTQFLYGLQKLF